ncbi:uncharacterized protein [Macrobrachium rosenbergii]|uniref:uncharacterized protein n=1 Tax=Macrobrachium rosenbergii TaxID=79674 RepID=UPI0034D7B3E0
MPDSKTSRHKESGIGELPQPCRCFSHIHVDVVNPIPQSGGARYLLAIIDHSTHWPEATPMKEASTTSCAEALLSSWISRFGVPNSITTDRGPAFLSELWVSLASLMGTKLHSTTAYNPTANGLHTAPKADGNASPAEKVYGETLVVPGEFFPPSAGGADMPLPRLTELSRKFAPCHRTPTDRTSRYNPPASDSLRLRLHQGGRSSAALNQALQGPHRVISNTAGTAAPTPKRGPGQRRKQPTPVPEVAPTPHPQFLRSRGPLQLPQHLRD